MGRGDLRRLGPSREEGLGDTTLPFFETLEPGLSELRAFGAWPSVTEIDAALSTAAGVHFEQAAPRRRPSATPYDARIVHDRVVPTRSNNRHDLMNALVWAAFPNAKRALHVRQLALASASAGSNARTIAHDTVAMLDEGGVLLLDDVPEGVEVSPANAIVFGHAIYQHLAEAAAPVYGLGVTIKGLAQGGKDAPRAMLQRADLALAGMLTDGERFTSHRCFPRVRVG